MTKITKTVNETVLSHIKLARSQRSKLAWKIGRLKALLPPKWFLKRLKSIQL